MLARLWDSDLAWSFRHSAVAMVSAAVLLALLIGALFCPWLAPSNPFDLASLNLMDSFKPPAWVAEGGWEHVLGTDDQGRDVLSGITMDHFYRDAVCASSRLAVIRSPPGNRR